MRATATLLVLLLLSALAAGQDRKTPGIPASKPKHPIKMTKPDKPEAGDDGAEEEKPKKEPKEPEPETDAFAKALESLKGWPSAAAREAASTLALTTGPEAEQKLIDSLALADPAQKAGVCFVLGEIGGDASLETIQRVAADDRMAEHLPTLFNALAKLDGANAVKRVFPFLRHPMRQGRIYTEAWLARHIDGSHVARLEILLEDPNPGARLSALRLLDRVDGERASERAFALIGDPNPEISLAATTIVAARADEEIIRRLNSIVGSLPTRRSAYAILGLVMISDRLEERTFEYPTIERLLGPRGLRSTEKVNRGAAAIALADIGYESEIPEIDVLLDREITLTLLDTFGGKTFFPDYRSLAELSRERFGMLTGIRDRRPVPDLWRWWEANKERFVARRALRVIDPEAVVVLRVLARSSVEPALPSTQFSTVTEDARRPETLGRDFVYLLEGEAKALAKLLSETILKLPDAGAVDIERVFKGGGDTSGPAVVLSASVENRARTVTGRAGAVPEALTRVIEELRRIRKENAWQRYWDRDSYPRYEDFIRAQIMFFTGNPSAEERARHMKDLILFSLDDLTTDIERTAAVRALGELPVDLSDSEAYRLAKSLEEEEGVTAFAESVVKVLVKSGRPLTLPVLATWAEKNPSPRTRQLFVEALAGVGEEELHRAARSDRVFLRRAAMTAAPLVLKGAELEETLSIGAEDQSSRVRRSALLSFGSAHAPNALEHLKEALDDVDATVRNSAIEAMGILGTPDVVPVLSGQLAADDPAQRVAAVQALAKTGLDQALNPVLLALEKDPAPIVRGVAAREITGFGDRALKGLSGIVMNPKVDKAVRAQAVEGLVRIGKDHVVDVLEALLADPMTEVADAAAYALAGRCRKAAVPRLLDSLDAGRNPLRAVAALEQVSSQSFSSARAEDLPAIYRGWWSESKEQSPPQWFAEALTRQGYDEKALAYLAKGNPGEEAVPELIRALMDDAWYIRANANLWLFRITTEDFGEVTRFTSDEEVREIHSKWMRHWKQ